MPEYRNRNFMLASMTKWSHSICCERERRWRVWAQRMTPIPALVHCCEKLEVVLNLKYELQRPRRRGVAKGPKRASRSKRCCGTVSGNFEQNIRRLYPFWKLRSRSTLNTSKSLLCTFPSSSLGPLGPTTGFHYRGSARSDPVPQTQQRRARSLPQSSFPRQAVKPSSMSVMPWTAAATLSSCTTNSCFSILAYTTF